MQSAKWNWSSLRRFDVYSKPLEELRIRTLGGALITLLSAFIMFSLFITELRIYLSTDLQQEIFVDVTRGNKMPIHLDIVFPGMPCEFLSLDTMDVSGEQQLDISHDMYKIRLDQDGNEISIEKSDVNTKKPNDTQLEMEKKEKKTVPACGSCYGAESAHFKCCNTCDHVREAYRTKGWAVTDISSFEQCRNEGVADKLKNMKKEGCRMHGKMLVNRVAGNFHFAPGKSIEQSHMHIHDLSGFSGASFNLSHFVKTLAFGETYDGQVNPLDGHSRILTDQVTKLITYYAKVVPTLYRYLNGTEMLTNQYSVTKHEKHSGNLPGMFVYYEISPILVKVTERHRSFGHFLTSLCAIIGGVFTVASLFDAFFYHSSRLVQQKLAIGKFT